MSGRRACSSSGGRFLAVGLILVSCASRCSLQVSRASCSRSVNISEEYQHCGLRAGGVRDLDCFSKARYRLNCTWRPGDRASRNTYTLVLRQRHQGTKKTCNVHSNVTELHHEIKPSWDYNVTVEVFQNPASPNCSKATFTGSPSLLSRCGPPTSASFSRGSGGLRVRVGWRQDDAKFIRRFHVRYKVLDGTDESSVESANPNECRVESVNSSVAYAVQIRCATSDRCSQCPWSEAYTVPPELLTRPVIVDFRETDAASETGQRVVSVTWKFPAEQPHDGYRVTVWKSSGEASEELTTPRPEVRLLLSSSAYRLNVSAFNNASASPAASFAVPERQHTAGAGRLNVTVLNSTALVVRWRRQAAKMYVCFSAEWKKRGGRTLHSSFYQHTENVTPSTNTKYLSPLPEPLEPYQRYSISLHMRPDKDTCNMKRINNSETTYGTTHFYSVEGSPISAPTNISSHSVTPNSAVLQWSPIPEGDVRGFLLGYVIHYTAYQHKGSSEENSITVDPAFNSYKLYDLESGTAYQVQISGFTSAGVGVRSTTSFFKTRHEGHFNLRGFITVLAVTTAVLIFGTPIIKRTKAVLWPSIPNPGGSKAVQKMDGPCQVELLGAMTTLKAEEWYTKSLQILDKDEAIPASPLASMLPLLRSSEHEGDSLQLTCDWTQSDGDSGTEDFLQDDDGDGAGTFSGTRQTHLQSPAFAFASDYTTMEMFQQLMPRGASADTGAAPTAEADPEDPAVAKPTVDYIRQFSSSPTPDDESLTL